jgi:eukaryotic-like serine/threonine-protein kinase
VPADPAADGAAALRQTGAAPLRPADPRHIGPYAALALLGSGGMGRVYLARAAAGGPGLFAVKVIRPEYAEDVRFRRRFEREAAVHGRLGAPYAPRLCGTGFQDELLWMATDYFPGLDLSAAVRGGGPLPPGAVWRIAADLGRALADLAAASIVHRDLKPSNVLLSARGAHVIDFGISKAADASAITGTGNRVGTPAYMSPEYLRSGECEPASDVFSLAGTLVYAATGRAPFGDGTGVDVMHRVAFEAPDPRLTGAITAADPDLGALLGACLTKDPGRRPAAGELADAAARRTGPPEPPGWPGPLGDRVSARQRAYETLSALPLEHALRLRAPVQRPKLTPPQGAPAGEPAAVPPPPHLPGAGTRTRTRRGRVLAAGAGLAVCAAAVGAAVVLKQDGSPAAAPGTVTTATGAAPGRDGLPAASGATDGASAAGTSRRGAAATADGDAVRPEDSGPAATRRTATATTGGPTADAPASPAASSAPAGPADPPWVTGCSYYSGYGRTRLGDSGKRVLQVQCVLAKRGYGLGGDGTGGDFGTGTQSAVRAFQSDRGLAADGVVDRDTWVALRGTG